MSHLVPLWEFNQIRNDEETYQNVNYAALKSVEARPP